MTFSFANAKFKGTIVSPLPPKSIAVNPVVVPTCGYAIIVPKEK